jgi:hypothetical protein
MTIEEIAAEEARIHKLEMGPTRWDSELALIKAKVACVEYKSSKQAESFSEWMTHLADASKRKGVEWGSDEIRAGYYEAQPDVWLPYYDDGCTPDEAIDSDMECWGD